ncbi:MAG: diguanylate cyclase [Elusimicrobiota bacterium]|jgi:diguanylate cyclase (GGDEF)-like protein
MKDKHALQKIREEFQKFQLGEPPRHGRRWSLLPEDKNQMLAHALLYLCEWMKIDRGAVFLLDDNRRMLLAHQRVDLMDVLPGEEEIALLPDSPISRLLDGKRPSLVLREPHDTAYLPLRAFGKIFGILRVENVRHKKLFTDSDIELLKDFTHELATALRALEIAASERERVGQMEALHEVSNAIFRSLRLDEMLKSVAQSLITQLGFDRTRIYLINREGESLENVLTMDQRQQEIVEKERYPLKRGVHPMVDMILGKTDDVPIEQYQRTIVYLPLRTRDENMGVLMVDNLLSQQEILPEQMPILTAIAGQLGMAIKNARLFQGVEELSITDGLTSLYLLRYFKQRLKEEFYRAERTHGQLSLMILDIDHFKRFNDSYGHPAGDTILSSVAERILANARKIDLTARYGGDEFIILLPDTSADEALLLAERLHHAVSDETVLLPPDKNPIHLTVSIGVATYPVHAATIDELIKRADEALYWSKSHGRNRIRLYSFEIPTKI